MANSATAARGLSRLLVLFSLLIGTSAAHAEEGETCAKLMDEREEIQAEKIAAYQDGLLAEFIDLENRVVDFLDHAPEVGLAAIGSNFPREVSEQLLAEETLSGEKFYEVAAREVYLRFSRAYVGDREWEVLSRYYADQELYRFLASALTHLKRGQTSQRMGDVFKFTRLYLQRYKSEIPGVQSLLQGSNTMREVFSKLAKKKLKKFNLDLTVPGHRARAAAMLENRDFGPPQTFIVNWFVETNIKMMWGMIGRLGYGSKGPINSFLEKSLDEKIDFILSAHNDEFHDPKVQITIVNLLSFWVTANPFYSAREVRAAIEAGLKEHHELLMKLVSDEESRQADYLEQLATYAYQPLPSAPNNVETDELDPSDLDHYIHQRLPLSGLKADHDYHVIFTRDYGMVEKVRTVRFTQRALDQLRDRQLQDQFPPEQWLAAIQAGHAPEKGCRGLKLLRSSPVRGLKHLEIEVKLLITPWRWLGYRDFNGRIVFDLFHNDH